MRLQSCSKVIGARAYNKGEEDTVDLTPADMVGHGTHTASTVAGVPVKGASLYGLGQGVARGGVPSARLAIYKACSTESCSDMNLLAAFEDAIDDGVDIISISIGGGTMNYFTDPIAIGSYSAMRKGILTSCSAGNSGPYLGTVENSAPWVLTVGAGSLDRQFRTPVITGNGMEISVSSASSENFKFQLVID